MVKILKRRKKTLVVLGAFQKLSRAVERRQRKAADYLNRKTAHFSRKGLVVGLIVFCAVFGGSSAFTIWYSLRSVSTAVKIRHMPVPRSALIQGDKKRFEMRLSAEELQSIRGLQYYLDSLKQTDRGKMIYDSIARFRPGLLDSLVFIEQRYHKQLKTREDGNKK